MAKSTAASETSPDPRFHTRRMSQRFDEIIDHLRSDIDTVNEPQFKAMFETAAEVLTGLKTAFQHYEAKSEAARKPQ